MIWRLEGKRRRRQAESGQSGARSPPWPALQQVADQHVAGLHRLAEAYLGSRAGIEVTGRDELAARLARGEVLVLGVRPAAEYAAGHTAGARSVPVAELRRHLNTLPADAADPLRGEGFTIHPVTGLTASRLTGLLSRPPGPSGDLGLAGK